MEINKLKEFASSLYTKTEWDVPRGEKYKNIVEQSKGTVCISLAAQSILSTFCDILDLYLLSLSMNII